MRRENSQQQLHHSTSCYHKNSECSWLLRIVLIRITQCIGFVWHYGTMITVRTITDLGIGASVATILQIRSFTLPLLPIIGSYDVSSSEWFTMVQCLYKMPWESVLHLKEICCLLYVLFYAHHAEKITGTERDLWMWFRWERSVFDLCGEVTTHGGEMFVGKVVERPDPVA
jgi:hypothetical protein